MPSAKWISFHSIFKPSGFIHSHAARQGSLRCKLSQILITGELGWPGQGLSVAVGPEAEPEVDEIEEGQQGPIEHNKRELRGVLDVNL